MMKRILSLVVLFVLAAMVAPAAAQESSANNTVDPAGYSPRDVSPNHGFCDVRVVKPDSSIDVACVRGGA